MNLLIKSALECMLRILYSNYSKLEKIFYNLYEIQVTGESI